MKNDYQFMVDFTLPETLTEEFMTLIPYQRERVNELFTKGKLNNYMLSLDDSKLWAVFNANSEFEVMEILTDLPLTRFMEVKISMLTFNNTNPEPIPMFSMN